MKPIRQSLFRQMLRDPAKQDFSQYFYLGFISLAISKEWNILSQTLWMKCWIEEECWNVII